MLTETQTTKGVVDDMQKDQSQSEATKLCKVCGLEKPVGEFYLQNGVPRSPCKRCHMDRAKARTQARKSGEAVSASATDVYCRHVKRLCGPAAILRQWPDFYATHDHPEDGWEHQVCSACGDVKTVQVYVSTHAKRIQAAAVGSTNGHEPGWSVPPAQAAVGLVYEGDDLLEAIDVQGEAVASAPLDAVGEAVESVLEEPLSVAKAQAEIACLLREAEDMHEYIQQLRGEVAQYKAQLRVRDINDELRRLKAERRNIRAALDELARLSRADGTSE